MPDADAAKAVLINAGFSAKMWDESYNRTLGVDDSLGRRLWINEAASDGYGYEAIPVESPANNSPANDIDVVAVHPSDDFERDRKLLRRLRSNPWARVPGIGRLCGHNLAAGRSASTHRSASRRTPSAAPTRTAHRTTRSARRSGSTWASRPTSQ